MDEVRYIHAADLHLDATFQGLTERTTRAGNLARRLREATSVALERLFQLCVAERPDFLVLAGDIYNHEKYSVRSQLELRNGCERLRGLGIRVFIAHGNHDPLSSRLESVNWPDNVTIFGKDVESHPILRDDREIAVIHGISHARTREDRNLATLFSRQEGDAFQLGVLHCTLEGEKKADRYAPCTLNDLLASGLDAWALGHVHDNRVLCRVPFVAYPGSAQGMHINENGPHGCLNVTATRSDNGWRCESKFMTLSPVHWEKLTINLSKMEKLDEVEHAILQEMEEAGKYAGPQCDALVARVTLAGRTPLDSELRRPKTCADLAEFVAHLSAGRPGVWLKDLIVNTEPAIDFEEARRREDLLGESLRLVENLRKNPAELQAVVAEALNPLFRHDRLSQALEAPDEAELQRMLDDVERQCVDLLEIR